MGLLRYVAPFVCDQSRRRRKDGLCGGSQPVNLIANLTQHFLPHRYPRSEAEGYCYLRPGPEPTEPFGRCRPCRHLQRLASLQRPGSLRYPSFCRCVLHHELGYREVSVRSAKSSRGPWHSSLELAVLIPLQQEPLPQLQGRTRRVQR